MGNVTGVAKAVKKQGQNCELYDYVDMKGEGILINLIKNAEKTKDYSTLDKEILKLGPRFLCNNGKGEDIKISDLIEYRNIDKTKFQLFKNKYKQSQRKFNNGSVFEKEWSHKICWKLKERGTVGETILHLCFLNLSCHHSNLAKRLIQHYPPLIHDIYAGDEYYGENVLHMAIVNEDPAMVKFLLDHGADPLTRACGNFFCPDDQKKSRADNLYKECYDVPNYTNYEGHGYFGEYPLSFAACLGQEECVRLLVAKDRQNSETEAHDEERIPLTDRQDTNGNTALHMLVIHDNKAAQNINRDIFTSQAAQNINREDMFDIILDSDAELSIKNNQGLTPLTLAAKLARKDMYEHILEKLRQVYWKFGGVTCAGYPLEHIDTISSTGEINIHSALNIIVYGQEQGHLDMMDGLVENLLLEKWKNFIRYRFYRRFITFTLYFIAFAAACFLRPGRDYCADPNLNTNLMNCDNITSKVTVIPNNMTNSSNNNSAIRPRPSDPCYLLRSYRYEDIGRLTLEVIVILSAVCYVFISMLEVYQQGFKSFFHMLQGAPSKALFLISCLCVIAMVPGRAVCAHKYEDYMVVFAIISTAPYFLFFCRGFHTVGPFVVMIYNMIKGDLLRFVVIYVIFLIGFSQAMFIVFREVENSPFNHMIESIFGMFVMSMGQFADFYDSINESKHKHMGRIIFLVYMVLVTLLLVNMLIAMMGNTYQLVASTEKEWLRQWAKIVLIVEQSVNATKRLTKQKFYSEPSKDGKRRNLVVRYHQTEKEIEEDKRSRAFHKLEQKKKKKKMRIRAVSSPKIFSQFDAEIGKINI